MPSLNLSWSFSPTFSFPIWFYLKGLDRKISVRATRDELIERGILLPDVASVGHTTTSTGSNNMPTHILRLPQQQPNPSSLDDRPIHGKI